MTNLKPHNGDAGYIAEKIYKPSNSHIVIYKAEEQEIDCGEKYCVVCTAHGAILGEKNIPSARKSMKYPEFCQDCIS